MDLHPRRRKSSAERRAQRLRAEQRAIGHFLRSFDALLHRGSCHTRLSLALRTALAGPATPTPPPAQARAPVPAHSPPPAPPAPSPTPVLSTPVWHPLPPRPTSVVNPLVVSVDRSQPPASAFQFNLDQSLRGAGAPEFTEDPLTAVRSSELVATTLNPHADAFFPLERSVPTPGISLPVAPGTMVRVTGLVARMELNGSSGRVLSFDETRNRYAVVLDPGQQSVLLRRENIQLL